ncbi:hypothetical protein BT69DRAFT_1302481 [Atractiella rhizophila]|nr:hypothetical protein BT69DRAFT_1302481 [Atractiella rhizophila]
MTQQIQRRLVLLYVAVGKPDFYIPPSTVALSVNEISLVEDLQDEIHSVLEDEQPTFKRLEQDGGRRRVRIWKFKMPLSLEETNPAKIEDSIRSINFPWNDPSVDHKVRNPENSLPLEILLQSRKLGHCWESQPDVSELQFIAEVLPLEEEPGA